MCKFVTHVNYKLNKLFVYKGYITGFNRFISLKTIQLLTILM
jgi:hypothetical protein